MSIPSYKTLKTPIHGLKIHLNKVVADSHGFFCDLAETDNPLWQTKIKHLHASIAIKKGVARGEHYHYRLIENFYILSGTALWIFHDFNKKSKTFGKTWSLVLDFPPKKNKLAQIEIHPYIYHAFWPLTNEKVVAFATGTTGYDPTDYKKLNIAEVPAVVRILKKYKIKI
ncbi:MAG: dTDP-4-dehydrorhamnose 3,5-epimerase family protein [Candidatus Spechtbacteria bacterium]|nr:dTDP-4-dehydrorhamnose 3,5-epimerase family protein [Candidatus Spechtbacteria bacterium]